ncbi:hypothetical protein B0H13DRAFT_2684206 [Mycena leptocephala]|nr:hypothetical protein B0H13DRAFT_2684206 [Mycena leptocephala]
MKGKSVLPVYRLEKQLGFNSKLGRASGSPKRVSLVGRFKDNAFAESLRKLWRTCTATADGSLSETFKLDTDGTSASGMSNVKPLANTGDSDSLLDVVVVDNEERTEEKAAHQSDGSSMRSGHGGSNSTGTGPGHRHDFRGFNDDPTYYQGGLKSWIRYRGWPQVVEFFEPRFPEHEEEYQAQTWHSGKLLAFSASLFLVANWVLYLILNNDSTQHSLYAKIAFWGGLTLFTLPTPVMVALDMPRRSSITFQIWFCIAVYYCAFAEVIQMRQCNFFSETQNHCFKKPFLSTMYYSTSLPALMMFVISKRLYNLIAQVVLLVLFVALITPIHVTFIRNVILFVVFSGFIQGLQYTSENGRRKLFLLALQLKQASKAKHKARLAESKAYFTKRRFANYIFHEVRVPLNNAMLAFQLLQSGNAFKEDFVSGTEVYALEQGLKMMKTVLNDVLDFEKMDSGHFETIPKPFPLHHSIRTILDQVEVQATARKLILARSLDERIDAVSLSLEPKVEEPEGLWVLGSELRLHQVLTNLAANAVKYTPEAGGSIRISTEFLGISIKDELPGNPPDIEQDQAQSAEKTDITATSEPFNNGPETPPTPMRAASASSSAGVQTQCLNFRLVVHDGGPGIKPSDLVEGRLFQPFAQTTVGRSSGSGTGLGLAIVRQIIKLSGGRLGVTSRRGEGSTFWVELSYPLASAAEIQAVRDANTLTAPLRDMGSGFMHRPLLSPAPSAIVRSPTDATPLSSIATAPPKPQSPLQPSAAPVTPLTALLPAADPLLVLVVDDDAVTRVLSSKLLTKLGCVVYTARDGRECVDMVLGADPHTYDLICLDNFMPVMTGEDAVKEIRANDRDDFVVGCTGNALTEDQISYREAGADDVVVKPVMIHDFKRLVQAAHQRRLERRALVP